MSKHPILVIEGPDGVGKTTLSDKLCDYLGAHYIHLTYRFRDKMHLYHGAALKMALLRAEHQPVVIDRWWPSELVYAAAYRGGSKWPLMYRHLQRVALRHGVSYVFCIPNDRQRYLEHFNVLKGQREEMYDSGMERVYDQFVDVLMHVAADDTPAVTTYDLFQQGADLDQVIQGIVEVSADNRARLPDYALDLDFGNLSGSPARAKYLIVDDDPGYANVRQHGPFTDYAPEHGLRWSKALDKADVTEADLCYVSVGHHDEERTVRAIREISRTTKVFALGEHAHETLVGMGVHVDDVLLHPRQWGPDHSRDHLNIWRAF